MKKLNANDLLIKYLEDNNMDYQELASKTGIHPTTLFRIVKKESTPNRTTLKGIADAMKFDYSYWKTGVLTEVVATLNSGDDPLNETPWRDEAYANLKEEKEYFKRNYEKLLEILLTGKKPENLNFHRALDYAADGFIVNINEMPFESRARA